MAKKKISARRERPRVRVKSEAYGEHERAARGTYKTARLNDAMKVSGKKTIVANYIAKLIKDGLDPYRAGFEDGKMWRRLLSLVKLNLQADDTFDLFKLEEFELHERFKLTYIFGYNLAATLSKNKTTLEVTTETLCVKKLNRDKADSYEQTVVILFFGDHEPDVVSQNVVLPLTPVKYREHITKWEIPEGAKTAVVALRCQFVEKGKTVVTQGRRAIILAKVIDVENG